MRDERHLGAKDVWEWMRSDGIGRGARKAGARKWGNPYYMRVGVVEEGKAAGYERHRGGRGEGRGPVVGVKSRHQI